MNDRVSDCEHCGKPARYGIEDRCRACNHPAAQWAPNVRLARQPEHVTALEARHRFARERAAERGTLETLDDLERFASRATAVVSVPVGVAHTLFSRDDYLYSPYEQQVAARIRAPAAFENDRRRRAVGNLLYGKYSEEILYGALTVDGQGLPSYGRVHLELETVTIAHRSTVLEENSFDFMERHAVTPGTPLPEGYMSPWERREKLVSAKLVDAIERHMGDVDYQRLILQSGADRKTDIFLEVHVFGTFNHQAVCRITISETPKNIDMISLKYVEEKARSMNLQRAEQ